MTADATTYHLRHAVRRHLKAMSATLVNAGMPEEVADQLAAKIHNIVWGVYNTYGPGSIGAAVTALADAQAATELASELTESSGEKPVQGLHNPECQP